MKRRFLTLLTITTALLMWSFNAFAEGKAPAPINVAAITTKISKIFNECYSYTDLANRIKDIKNVDQAHILDVTLDSESCLLTVKLSNGEEKKWRNPLYAAIIRNNVTKYEPAENKRIGKTVWIGNGLAKDERFFERAEMLKVLAQRLADTGFDVSYTPVWHDSLAFNSDIILYHGHGASGGTAHEIKVGFIGSDYEEYAPKGLNRKADTGYGITEEYIKNKKGKMQTNAFVYLACCDLLDNNDNMADAFTKKGAAAVVGYEGSASRAAIHGAAFIDQLAIGKSISEAYEFLDEKFDAGVLSMFNPNEQKRYATGLKEAINFAAEAVAWADIYDILYRNEYTRNVVYNDVVGREELTRLYKLLNGDGWDEAAKKNWLSDLPITEWAGVSVSKLSTTISVTINSGNLNLPSDLTIEDFNRIATITLPKDSRVNNLTIQNCRILTHNPVIACNNLKIKGCPALYGIKLNGAKNVSIDDCEVLRELVISDALEVESLTVSNCKLLKDFECRSVSYSGKPESSLKSLNFKDCDMLHRVDIHGCPISGTLDLSNCKGLRYLSISVTNIQHIEVGELESLSVRQTPIKQTYESLPGVKKFYVQSKYMYTRIRKFEHEEEIPDAGEGFQYVGDLGDYHYYYHDGSGFYHKGEPDKSVFWDVNKLE